METIKETLTTWKEILAYCEKNIEDYELRAQLALKAIDRMRCPLSMADPNLFSEIESQIEDWCLDTDRDFYEMDIDPEDILFYCES